APRHGGHAAHLERDRDDRSGRVRHRRSGSPSGPARSARRARLRSERHGALRRRRLRGVRGGGARPRDIRSVSLLTGRTFVQPVGPLGIVSSSRCGTQALMVALSRGVTCTGRMRRNVRMRALVAACALATQGCSFVRPPPDSPVAGGPPRCTESRAAPIADTVLAGAALALFAPSLGAALSCSPNCAENAGPALS